MNVETHEEIGQSINEYDIGVFSNLYTSQQLFIPFMLRIGQCHLVQVYM